MVRARVVVIIFGLLLPYLARIPGVFFHGQQWFLSFLGSGVGAFVFLGVFNALCWGSVLVSTLSYRHPRSTLFPVVFGFSLPAVAYGSLDLLSSSTAAIALIFIPIYALPLVLIGWWAGWMYDRKLTRSHA